MYKDMYGNNRLKVGLHIHTTVSDGKATPEEAARIYKEAGFDAVALTDHWKYNPEGELLGLKIISGAEYNIGGGNSIGGVIHIVGVGMETEPRLDRETATAQEIIDEIRNCGGLAILAHPAWSLNSPEMILPLKGIEGVEIYNSVSNAGESTRPYSGYFIDIMANMDVSYPILATDDTHYYEGADETKSYIMVKSEENTAEAILNAIRKQDFYATQGPEVHIRREGDKIIADCSECVLITFLSNAVWAPNKTHRGENLTHAEYTMRDFDKWVRVEVTDKSGNSAWSNILKIE